MQYEDMLNFPKKMELSGEGGGGDRGRKENVIFNTYVNL